MTDLISKSFLATMPLQVRISLIVTASCRLHGLSDHCPAFIIIQTMRVPIPDKCFNSHSSCKEMPLTKLKLAHCCHLSLKALPRLCFFSYLFLLIRLIISHFKALITIGLKLLPLGLDTPRIEERFSI